MSTYIDNLKIDKKKNAKCFVKILIICILTLCMTFANSIISKIHECKSSTFVYDTSVNSFFEIHQGYIDNDVEKDINKVCKEIYNSTGINIIFDTKYNTKFADDYETNFNIICDKIHNINSSNKDNTILFVRTDFENNPYVIYVGKNLRDYFTPEKCHNIIYSIINATDYNKDINYKNYDKTNYENYNLYKAFSVNSGLIIDKIATEIEQYRNIKISNRVNIVLDKGYYEKYIYYMPERDNINLIDTFSKVGCYSIIILLLMHYFYAWIDAETIRGRKELEERIRQEKILEQANSYRKPEPDYSRYYSTSNNSGQPASFDKLMSEGKIYTDPYGNLYSGFTKVAEINDCGQICNVSGGFKITQLAQVYDDGTILSSTDNSKLGLISKNGDMYSVEGDYSGTLSPDTKVYEDLNKSAIKDFIDLL